LEGILSDADNKTRKMIEGYYAAMDANTYDAALSCLAEDVVYAVPVRAKPTDSDRRLTVFRGKAAVEAYFSRRAPTFGRHVVRDVVIAGDIVFVAGIHEAGNPDVTVIVSRLRLNAESLIDRYFVVGRSTAAVDAASLFG
jgi:ketosteroid isomerase-like protein